jgi:hypothetical protein
MVLGTLPSPALAVLVHQAVVWLLSKVMLVVHQYL